MHRLHPWIRLLPLTLMAWTAPTLATETDPLGLPVPPPSQVYEQIEEALPLADVPLRSKQNDTNNPQQVRADEFLQQGIQQFRVSQFREALQSWQAALEIYREIGDQQGEAYALGNLGLAYDSLGDYQQAIDFHQQSLVIIREIGDLHGEGRTLNNLGLAYRNLGDYQQAIDFHQQAFTITREMGDRQTEGRTLNNLGLAYYNLGDYQQAIDFFQQSLVIAREIGNRQGEGRTLGNLGLAYNRLGDYQQAIDFHQQALTITREIGDRQFEGATLGNLGIAYDSLGNYQQAIDLYQQSLVIKREIGDRQGEGGTLGNLGNAYYDLGDYQQAIALYQQALTITREIGDRQFEGATLGNLGNAYQAQNQVELAIVFYKAAVNTYETIRESNRGLEQTLQETYITTIESTYRHLAQLLLEQDRILEAQRVLDLLKVQELDDYLRGVRSSDNARQGAELVPPEQVIARAHDDLTDQAIANGKRLSQLEAQETLTDAQLDEMVSLQAERTEILQAFNTFRNSPLVQEQLALLSREELTRNVQLDQLAALRDNLGQIPQGAVMLYPLILDNQLELIVTSPYTAPIHRTVNVTADELRDQVTAFRYALAEPTRDAKAPAQQLYEWLIEPIEQDLADAGVKTIIYAPDRTLRYIPLAALYDGEQWLTERYRINHITAASLTDLNTPPKTDPTILAGALTEGPLTVSVGETHLTLPLLDFVDDEVNGIAALDPEARALLGGDFNPALIQREANRHNILHLATHAQFLIEEPESSFILFSGGQRWTLADLAAGLLSLDQVDLVVLSACETGVDNTFGNGAEILSFGHLMQTAGARAAISSLWMVDDGGTQILMTAFYEGLIDGNLSKVAALQQAQLELIRLADRGDRGGFELANAIGLDPDDLSHPYYWAPFILIGNGL